MDGVVFRKRAATPTIGPLFRCRYATVIAGETCVAASCFPLRSASDRMCVCCCGKPVEARSPLAEGCPDRSLALAPHPDRRQ